MNEKEQKQGTEKGKKIWRREEKEKMDERSEGKNWMREVR